MRFPTPFLSTLLVAALACCGNSASERATSGELADTSACPGDLHACPLGATVTTTGAAFRVWAPDARSASVVGTFNQWQPGVAPMTSLGDGTWATSVPIAAEGDEYKYVFERQDGALWRSDPRSLALDERGHDNSVIVRAPSPAARFAPPPRAATVLYELHIPTFSIDPAAGHGTFRSAVGKLDALVDLGVDAIELMPLHENPGETGWGYGPKSLFAIESGYGQLADLRALVDAAHARGIAVIIDWVPNHLIGGNVLDQYDTKSASSASDDGIYFYPDARGQTPWGPRPDYRAPEVRAYIEDSLAMWIDRLGFDGARTDSTVGMRRSAAGDLPEAWTLMQELNAHVDRVCPECLVIAEDLQNDEWINRAAGEGGAGFDAQWNEDFFYAVYDAMRATDDGARDVDRIAGALRQTYLGDPFKKVIYTENHDKVPSDRQQRFPRAISPADPTDYWARKRSTLAAAILLTAPGIPMLFEGQEFLETTDFDFPSPAALDWTNRDRFSGIVALYRDLIALRRNTLGTSAGLLEPDIATHHVNRADKVLAYLRGSAGHETLVIANLANRRYDSYLVGVPAGGTWRVHFNSDARVYSSDFGDVGGQDAAAEAVSRDGLPFRISVPLAPYTALVLSR